MQAGIKCLGGVETQEANRKAFAKHQNKVPKATWMSPNLGNTLAWQTSSSKTSCKKEKENNIELKGLKL
jgi:hypothetical protein